ncbi:unnamed protein product, partial [Rangifer tarandus platyrhynchus]
ALSPWPAALLSHAAGVRRPQPRRASGDRPVPAAAPQPTPGAASAGCGPGAPGKAEAARDLRAERSGQLGRVARLLGGPRVRLSGTGRREGASGAGGLRCPSRARAAAEFGGERACAPGISRQDGRGTDGPRPRRSMLQRRGSSTETAVEVVWPRATARDLEAIPDDPEAIPGDTEARMRVLPGHPQGISPTDVSSVGVLLCPPGRILPFLSPWVPDVRACTHHRQHPVPQQLVRENALLPYTGTSTALTCNLLCPASPLGD